MRGKRRCVPVDPLSVTGLLLEHQFQHGQFVACLSGYDEIDGEAFALFISRNHHGASDSGDVA